MRPPFTLTILAALITTYVASTISLLARAHLPYLTGASATTSSERPIQPGPVDAEIPNLDGHPPRTSPPAQSRNDGVRRDGTNFRGYLTFCPCMGRIGNQLSQTMGVLALARRLNRTLLLPPLIEYRRPGSKKRADAVPWGTYFNVSAANEYVPAVPLESFLASEEGRRIWPPDRRGAFCQARGCGRPGGSPIWEELNVTFAPGADVFYGERSGGRSGLSHFSPAEKWDEAYPPSEYPVLAFAGAPAPYPEREEDRALQRYVDWTDAWKRRGREWREDRVPGSGGGKAVGVHLRNGIDWDRGCAAHVRKRVEGGEEVKRYMASPQCLGERNEHGSVTAELCFPSEDTVVRQVKRAVDEIGAAAVMVAAEEEGIIAELRRALPEDVAVVGLPKDDVHLTLVVLSQSDLFIGNCASSFTSIVSRTRAAAQKGGLPTWYWAFSGGSEGRKSLAFEK